ncbi:DMT family transporter [Dendronalium sp. ChiSLP03b]|uniref:DMT family transporter n=1 Tax=Dendronalium sp. ChiSLP03b TaxID=3075381 RepID=UPI002AD5AEE2|nr:DMT family transporter [Dendronalium sp. ChiSLP03b]MDZ8205216.1 DMT family transporter [Dendronalium sp. ChiSLP03b]
MFNNFLSFALTDGKGEVAALSAACLWAVASVVYGIVGQRIPPLHLNLIKGIVAIALLLFTISLSGEFFPNLAPLPLSLLLLSGAVGIGLGDTAFLAAINYLGARRVLLIGTLAPPMTAIAATILLQEQLNVSAWCGILLTILGVAWVVTERVPSTSDSSTTHLWRGISYGLLAAITNAAGTVISRVAFTTANISPLWAALLRLSAAVLVILVLVSFSQHRDRTLSYPYWRSQRVILASCFAAFCGTYLGIWLQQTAIKLTPVGIASTLIQTSPLFVIPIAIYMGEKVSWRAIAGVIIAIAGIGLLFYFK